MTNNHPTTVRACGQTEAIKQISACMPLFCNFPISLHARKIMKSKVIVQLVSLAIMVLFSSGFAQKICDEEGLMILYNRYANELRNCGIMPNRTWSGDAISQEGTSLPRNFCGVSDWRRVISVDASSGECPNNFSLYDLPGSGIKVCLNDITPGSYGSRLHRTNYSIDSNVSFTKVAGLVEGYQFGSPDAFSPRRTVGGLDGFFFSYGNYTKQHLLWAYAAGLADKNDRYSCPCSTVPGDCALREFGRFHYCDTGNSGKFSEPRWFTEKVLWSGVGCPTTSTCCNNPNLPYFCRTDLDLQKTRKADRFVVTMRFSDVADFEDIGITKLELYIS